jgi:hypothetical protein
VLADVGRPKLARLGQLVAEPLGQVGHLGKVAGSTLIQPVANLIGSIAGAKSLGTPRSQLRGRIVE